MKKKKKWFRALVRQRFFIILLLVLQLAAIIFFLANRSHASVAIKYMLQIVSFIVALHIIAKRDKGAYKLTWVFTILIFPLFGGCLYLLFRYQTRSKKLRMTMQNITDTTRPAALLPGDKYSLATKPHCPLHAEHGDSPDDACIKASEQELQTSYSAPEALPCEACCMGDKFDRVVEMVPSHARQIEYLDKFAGFPVYENTRIIPKSSKRPASVASFSTNSSPCSQQRRIVETTERSSPSTGKSHLRAASTFRMNTSTQRILSVIGRTRESLSRARLRGALRSFFCKCGF